MANTDLVYRKKRKPHGTSTLPKLNIMDDFEERPRPILNKRRPQNRKTKTVLLFDEAARKEYLTGFHKRKNERRKKAKAENEKKVKEERRALKEKVREMIRKSDQHRVPEVAHLLEGTVYDLPEHTVTVTDISEINLSNRFGSSTSNDVKNSSQDKTAKDESAEMLKKQQKKLIHKLAQVGNPPSVKRKMKRLGKFKHGGGKGRFKGKDRSHSQAGGRKGKNHKPGNKKHKHK